MEKTEKKTKKRKLQSKSKSKSKVQSQSISPLSSEVEETKFLVVYFRDSELHGKIIFSIEQAKELNVLSEEVLRWMHTGYGTMDDEDVDDEHEEFMDCVYDWIQGKNIPSKLKIVHCKNSFLHGQAISNCFVFSDYTV